jgi:UTP--glucose-1-phosphate uridylyltransferase
LRFHVRNKIYKWSFSISTAYRVNSPEYNISMKPIRKAIFPVAGLGTRFLPATKAMPKEMLPVVDRPLIQYVVDEAREAGIEHFIFVTGRNKHIIEDHFDRQVELENALRDRQRREVIEFLARELPLPGTTSFTRQQEPLGLGHAVWCARELVGPEPFALLLPDMLIQHNPGCLAQMIDAARHLDDAANKRMSHLRWVIQNPADR